MRPRVPEEDANQGEAIQEGKSRALGAPAIGSWKEGSHDPVKRLQSDGNQLGSGDSAHEPRPQGRHESGRIISTALF